MTGKKCEVCGREIENPTNRQRFCKECAKKRQAEAFHRYYLVLSGEPRVLCRTEQGTVHPQKTEPP